MPVARDAAMGRAATRRRSTGALSSCGVHPAASAQWLGAIASGADLSAAVPSRMGHAGSVWTRPKRLNGQLGMTAVLHTWGQTLGQHVHLHCLVPAGALGDDGHWHAARSNYLFPVRALSRRYRGLMVSALRHAASQHQLPGVTQAGEVDR